MVVTRSASRSQRGSATPQPPSAADSSPAAADIDPVTRSRTIAHMNKDHTEDMSAILQHYSRLSAAEAAGAEMLGLDLTTMTIRSASGEHAVPVTPPMDTWNDRRARLVDMTIEARKALGLEVVEEPGHAPPPAAGIHFYPPRGADWFSFTGLTLYYVSALLVYCGQVTPGSAVWQFLDLVRFPYGPVGYIWLVKKILLLVLGIHAVECFWLDRSRLTPGGLRRGSMVWWLWIGAGFFEGLPAYRRWDRLVKGKTSKIE